MAAASLSTDNGTSWTQVDPRSIHGVSFYAFAVFGTNIFAGTDHGVFLSTNNGTSWIAVNTGLTSDSVNVLVVSLSGAGGKNLFAGTRGGVFLLSDSGTSWGAVNTGGLTNINILALAVSGTNLIAGTDGSGVWTRPLSEMITGVADNRNRIPTEFALNQNYPNPFNPSTVISYQLPVNSFVALKVYDVLGREMEVLVNERQSVGSHSAIFNASNLSGGVYFYRLQAGSYSETKKLMLLK